MQRECRRGPAGPSLPCPRSPRSRWRTREHPSPRESRQWSSARCHPADERADSPRPGGESAACFRRLASLTQPLWLLGSNRHVALGADGTVAEVVVVQEGLSLHFLPAGWLEILDMQGERVRPQDLVAAQY